MDAVFQISADEDISDGIYGCNLRANPCFMIQNCDDEGEKTAHTGFVITSLSK